MIGRIMRRPIVWIPVSGVLLVLLVWRTRLWEAIGTLPPLDPWCIAGAIALDAVVILAWGARSAWLLAAAERPIRFADATSLASMAFTLNAVTPASIGEAVRAAFLRQRYGVDYATGVAVILVERFGALFYLTTTSLIAWLVAAQDASPATALLAWVALLPVPLLVVRSGAGTAHLLAAAGRVAASLRSEHVADASARVDATIASLLGSPASLLAFAATSAIIFGTYAGQLMLALRAVGASIDFLTAWGAIGLSMTAGVLSLLPFGLGSTDVVLTGLLVAAGLSPLEAGAAAVVYRLASTVPLGFIGAIAYSRESALLGRKA